MPGCRLLKAVKVAARLASATAEYLIFEHGSTRKNAGQLPS